MERKARSQAQQAAHDVAVHKPGRPNGKDKVKTSAASGWNESSDEEEEDEEDEEGTSDEEPRATTASRTGHTQAASNERGNIANLSGGFSSRTSVNDSGHQSQQRPLRSLPQIPAAKAQAGEFLWCYLRR